ncbi:nucleoside triphosphate pyrophosphohydrolase family protein [Agathobaculum sp.]|uniref:nucleoside triphosphate pyrophosphohydrolase family protein n=1 Tax=Agathobaculum sp. TaxID=2048138 RepID=UPI003AF0DF27
MTPNEYQRKAMRTATGKCYDATNAALGIAGEAGEVADEVKKFTFQGHDWNPSRVVEELGDVLWYVALMADLLNVPLEYVMQTNIEKLERRYPDGFSNEASVNRSE